VNAVTTTSDAAATSTDAPGAAGSVPGTFAVGLDPTAGIAVGEEMATAEPTWLTEIRLRAHRRMLWCRELWARHRHLGEETMAIGHGEVELALASRQRLLAAELEFYRVDEQASAFGAELDAVLAQGPDERWGRLCSTLGLSVPERGLLALALAAELVPALRRVYGYLQDETAPLDPTSALVAELWCQPHPPPIGADGALVRWALAQPREAGAEPTSSSTPWVADPLLLAHLLEDYHGRSAPLGRPVIPPDGPRLYEAEVEDVVAFARALAAEEKSTTVEIELVAPAGAGRTTLAARVAARLGQGLVAVDARAVAAAADPVAVALRERRSALLTGALLAWRHAEALPDAVRDSLAHAPGLVFMLCERPLATGDPGGAIRRRYVLSSVGRTERLRLWAAMSQEPPPQPITEWALRPGEIQTLAKVASVGERALTEVCKGLLHDIPHGLLSPLSQPYTWEDFVAAPRLIAHLRELEEQARSRGEVLDDWGLAGLTPLGRGVTALFSGPSGTGKTMAAQVLSRSLGLELYRVDLAGVVNKYIGETEKHLRALFEACERAPVMLFFDEADALFGRRTQVEDAHDRFANIEIDYLLQRMEQFDGLAVLATNRKSDLDTAFMRRLRFTIDFAPPTVAERERLWRLALEGRTDTHGRALAGEINWTGLARELNLTGAGVKAAALAAAFLARGEGTQIATSHLLAAAHRELEKQGTVVRAGKLEAA
jgi:adenylate kinase family enzyme